MGVWTDCALTDYARGMGEVITIYEPESLESQLCQELCAVIHNGKYDELRIWSIIGVLETLKSEYVNG